MDKNEVEKAIKEIEQLGPEALGMLVEELKALEKYLEVAIEQAREK